MMAPILIATGLFLVFLGGIAATTIEDTGPWTSIIWAGVGILTFISGFSLYLIERKSKR